MDDAALISVVQHYQELYNLKHPHYSNLQRRQNIWEEVAKILKQSANVCKERWTRLRDNHRRALKLRQTKSGQAATKMKPPKFERELAFLVPYLADDDKRVSNIPSPSASNTDEEEAVDMDNDEEGLTAAVATASMSTPEDTSRTSRESTPCIRTAKARKRAAPEPVSVASVLKDYIEKKQKPADPLTAFFMTMAETVRNFPLTEQIKIKRDIFNIVNDTESRLALRSATNTTHSTTHFYDQASCSLINSPGFSAGVSGYDGYNSSTDSTILTDISHSRLNFQ